MKVNKYQKKRASVAEAKFNKTMELKKLGLSAKQISGILSMGEFGRVATGTVLGYLKHNTFQEYREYNRNKKKKNVVVLEAVAKKEEKQSLEPNTENFNKALDLIAEAYELLKHIKWGLK